ncbi:bifunctional 2',3'-cyclic-nucleotide 2'-phosphodiesterase/3'-nucleotidase [Roseovarius sp. MBR-6]|uniref:bifunctional 2',3'-cyclic-nucleotide 2'-phosphodiesterase/3'-nucleotidase n=1 Tax=Roseovarius sp. MBR-6 TaxID=3156459 RepID=UPI0033948EA2
MQVRPVFQPVPATETQSPTGPTFTLRLLATSDVHGHILPQDYFTGRHDTPVGLARLATLIAQARAQAGPENCLLLDNGDFLQGTPLTDLTARPGNGWRGRHPVIRAMNLMGYDAAALGNHEFNFGLDWLCDTLSQARFPVLCANAVRATGRSPLEDTPFLPSVTILTRHLRATDGGSHEIRIGLIGLTPPQVTVWDHAHLAGRITTRDMVETARHWVPELRARGADIVIALAHTGIDAGPDRPGMENAARALARVPGIDALIAGHSHRIFPGPDHAGTDGADMARGTLCGVPCVKPGYAASHLGQIDLHLGRGARGWQVTGHAVTLHPAAGAPPCPRLTRALARAHAHTLRLIDRALGETRAPLHSYLALVRDDPGLALVNTAQAAALAEAIRDTPYAALPLLSASAPFKTGGRGGPDHFTDIPAGPVRLRNIADLYGFPNTLYGLLVTGANLRDWLERAAICFNRITPGAPGQTLLDPAIPGHVFDVIAGLSYAIDLTSPARYDLDGALVSPQARRIRGLTHRGHPVADSDRFVIATNSYRAWGGGPFPALAEGRLIHQSTRPVRDLIADHVARLGPIAPMPPGTWRFAPLPDTSVTIETGPGLRAYPQEIEALGAQDHGLDAKGFLHLSLPLPRAAHPSLANPAAAAYIPR